MGADRQDIIVIGGGPAGLFCAIHAAAPGTRVLVLEKNPQPGNKLLLAGSGQCNLTHDGDIRSFPDRYGDHGRFVRPSLMGFTNRALVSFFEERGLVLVTEENGKVFPASRKSADVLAVLLGECRKKGVAIRCAEPVEEVVREEGLFAARTPAGSYAAPFLVITTGGASYPSCGTTGDGYRLAGMLGQPVTEIGPALSPLLISPFPFAGLAGMTFPSLHFSVWRNGKKQGDYCGDLLFTHFGLSGPGILDASRWIRAGDVLRLSFAGELRREEFAAEIARLAAEHPGWQAGTLLARFRIPERLVRRLLAISRIPDQLTCAHLPAPLRSALVTACTECPVSVERVGDFSIAMATRGGVALDGVNPKTMESKLVPGLFFAGEVLDIDGDTGGYNLQAAFSTGYCAAQALRARMQGAGDAGRFA